MMRASKAAQAMPASEAPPRTPVATVIPGKHPLLDCNDGVRTQKSFLSIEEEHRYLGHSRAVATNPLALLTQGSAGDDS
jgi:hypothetical protein